MDKSITCAFCSGKAKVLRADALWYACQVCDGEGEIPVPRGDSLKDCRFCSSTGRVLRPDALWHPCEKCGGKGKRFIKSKSARALNATWIKDGDAFHGMKTIKSILVPLSGKIRVCDPFLNDDALDTLELIVGTGTVLVLCKKGQATKSIFKAFKKDHPNFYFRQVARLHDRYVLTADSIILLGRGLSGIGMGDSYVIELNKDVARDLITVCRSTFDAHWANGTTL